MLPPIQSANSRAPPHPNEAVVLPYLDPLRARGVEGGSARWKEGGKERDKGREREAGTDGGNERDTKQG